MERAFVRLGQCTAQRIAMLCASDATMQLPSERCKQSQSVNAVRSTSFGSATATGAYDRHCYNCD
jgi:hypothetical protein